MPSDAATTPNRIAPVRPLLEIEDLHVSVEGQPILRGVDLTVEPGQVHALMGPNGSGKSTLANVLLGNPAYEVTSGAIRFHGEDITAWPTDVRGKAGIFLAFQEPESIGGVPVIQFLRQALSARRGMDMSVLEVRLMMMEWMEKLGMDPAFGERHLNDGFSGGEKKRNEILQMAILEPELAVLDETDSGLDVDALRTVARASTRCGRPDPSSACWSSPTISACSTSWPPTGSICWSTASSWPKVGPSWPRRSRSEGYDAWRR